MIKLLRKEIEDNYLQENFLRIEREINSQDLLRGQWKFFELDFSKSVTNFRFQHRLPFLPKDVIQTSLTGVGALTFNYDLFTKEHLDVSTTGPCVVRFFVGAYLGAGEF